MFRAYAKKKLIQSGHRRRRPHLSYIDLAFLILSPPLQNFHVVLPIKMSPLFFISRSRYLSLFFSLMEIPWPIAYVLFFSVFLFLYIPDLWT